MHRFWEQVWELFFWLDARKTSWAHLWLFWTSAPQPRIWLWFIEWKEVSKTDQSRPLQNKREGAAYISAAFVASSDWNNIQLWFHFLSPHKCRPYISSENQNQKRLSGQRSCLDKRRIRERLRGDHQLAARGPNMGHRTSQSGSRLDFKTNIK